MPMRTTVTLDDEIHRKALAIADPGMDKADLFREAVKTFIRVQSAKRLAAGIGAADAGHVLSPPESVKSLPLRASASGFTRGSVLRC
jgi:predicted transcriptional regulator